MYVFIFYLQSVMLYNFGTIAVLRDLCAFLFELCPT